MLNTKPACRNRGCWQLLLILFAALLPADVDARTVRKCLFIGDSITLHGPAKDLGWTGNWGMAASRPENDYVHRLYRKICRFQPDPTPQLLISGRDTGTAGRIDNALKVLDQLRACNADLIVIQLGENEKAEEVTPALFRDKYERLVAALKESGSPLILCTGVWSPGAPAPYPADSVPAKKDAFIREVCRRHGCLFVDIAPVASRKENAAWDDKQYTNWGVRWHPGDRGMQGYADAIWAVLEPALKAGMTEDAAGSVLTPVGQLTGIVPEPKRVYRFKDNPAPFTISSKTVIVVPKDAAPLVHEGVSLLRDDLRTLYGMEIPVVQDAADSAEDTLLICNAAEGWEAIRSPIADPLRTLPGAGRESYRLAARPQGVLVAASAPPGVFYGIQTLRQMLRADATIPSLVIADWPDQVMRTCYLGFPDDPDGIVRKMARLKINACLVESKWHAGGNWWYNPTGKNRELATSFLALCRRYNIEPIPLVQGLGWAYGVVDINPNCAEGVWVPDEKHSLKGTTPVTLNHPNVIRTKAAPIAVTNREKTRTYTEGKDYRIIPGLTVRQFQETNKPWQIARVDGGGIADGETVVVSYNYMTYCGHQSPYCPSEPLTYQIVDDTLKNVIALYHPRFIHIGHDEVIHIRRCSRCLNSGRSAIELVGRDIQHWYDTIKRLDPTITILMWDDLLRENHPGGSAISFVPNDIIICPWTYHGNPEANAEILRRLNWFLGKNNRPTMGTASGYWHENIWLWNQGMAGFTGNPNNHGFMFTHWGEALNLWSALSFTAECMWSRDKLDKATFDLYAQADRAWRKIGLGLTLSGHDQREGLAKRVRVAALSGPDAVAEAKELSRNMIDLREKIMKRVLPELAANDVAAGTVPERILTQMTVLPDYYRAMGLYVQARRLAEQGNKPKARDTLAQVVKIFKRWHFKGPSEADSWLRRYDADNTFPTAQTVFGVDLTLPDSGIAKGPAAYSCRSRPAGRWDEDAFWANVPAATNFVLPDVTTSQWQTRVQVVYDKANLYARFTCDIPAGSVPVTHPASSGIPVWEDDCIQLFLKPEPNEKTYYQVMVNAAGRTETRVHEGKDKPVALQTLCRTRPKSWTCTMAVPLSWITGRTIALGQSWRVNFTRKQTTPAQLTTWAILPEGAAFWFLQPDNFGTMTFEK